MLNGRYWLHIGSYFQWWELTTVEWTADELPVTASVQSEAEQLLPVFGTSRFDSRLGWTIRRVCIPLRVESRGRLPPRWPRQKNPLPAEGVLTDDRCAGCLDHRLVL